jgi:oligoendopeptidase F
MLQENLSQTWDLERFAPGGCGSPAFKEFLRALDHELGDLTRRAEALSPKDPPARWAQLIMAIQDSAKKVGQASAFAYCSMSQDTRDTDAKMAYGISVQISAVLTNIFTLLEARAKETTPEHWQAILAEPSLQAVAWNLNELRQNAMDKMPADREVLAVDLAVSGYHAWGELYDQIVGRMTIPVEIDGKVEELSVGQASNKFADPNRDLRAKTFAGWQKAWEKEAELIGAALNNLAGFRLNLYKHRGWTSVLKEPLSVNRMKPETLQAMWEAVRTAREPMKAFMARKAKLLGLEKLAWYDKSAPISAATRKVAYGEAAQFIVDQFGRFSPRMASFAARAFNERWIEVEDRANKMPGGYCIDFPVSEQTRIFMTYSGDAGGVATLAHELGHAYHAEVVWDLPPLARNYAMNVAETASTFAELIVSSAAIKHAASKEERIALLNNRLNDAAAYLMNIPARFFFEQQFYAERQEGPVAVDRLNELMEQAQREWYADSLSNYEPLFWASKGHFYGTYVPFYNFPYTFGYLFSAAIYQRALAEGPAFEQKYVDLLRDTGRMTVEELAERHLGVDLTEPAFWISGTQVALGDVKLFLELTEG